MTSSDVTVIARLVATVVVVGCLATIGCHGSKNGRSRASTITFPPAMRVQPEPEVAYKIGDTVEIVCVAEAFPPPQYSWTKNGVPLNANAAGIRQEAGKGTLLIDIDEVQSHHDGVYQCRASNSLGTAVSVKTLLKRATLDPFPTIKDPQIHRVSVGSSLTLKCKPPASYPVGSVYWGETKNGPKLRPIENTDRISLDYEGGLHFANVEMDDSRNGAHYVCVVQNLELRNIVEGDDRKIEPNAVTASPRYEPPRVMWSTLLSDIAVRGQTKKMKCIFSGFPTPRVTWRRMDSPMPEKNEISSFGQELIIKDADFNDQGRYQCSATNTVSGSQVVVKDFTLNVESTPFWRDGAPPEDVNTSEDEDASFECNVNGFPRPVISWSINGVPLEDTASNPRRSVSPAGNSLMFRGVTKEDAQVIQCNASNTHGYIFANAYLNVLAEAPSFRQTPQELLKVAVGRVATLTCRVFGAPKPTIVWQRGSLLEDVMAFHDSRISVLSSGDLEIQDVNFNDNDTYQCYTCNKFGCDRATGQLLVIEKTVIVDRPRSQVISAPNDVTLTCAATTDQSELSNLRVEWRRNDVPISPTDDRVVISNNGSRLSIVGSRVGDTGTYTCHAENGIDSDTVSIQITVKDRPEPPLDVQLATCHATFAVVTWSPADDNNDRVTNYVVYYVTSHDRDVVSGATAGSPHEGARVDGSARSARVKLSPWAEYTFSVAAVNSVGTSDATVAYSATDCVTPPSAPSRSPDRVCTDSRKPDQLIIVWKPMLLAEHHGEGFRYVITYRRRDRPESETRISDVTDWRQSELIVEGQPTYREYEISVLARNNLGDAPAPTRMIGYSGEDVPLEVPVNFELVESSLNSTSATFTWDEVDTSFDRIRGFFRGYQIKFWRKSNPSDVRTENIILREWSPCRPVDMLARYRRGYRDSGPVVRGSTTRLWPYSDISAGVVVLNGALAGEISNIVEFTTPEGVPGPVLMFTATERGSSHIRLTWQPPEAVNGVLTGYIIGYMPVTTGGNGNLHEMSIDDPHQVTKKIFGLEDRTQYMVTIWATTRVGRGVESVVQASTVEIGKPDQPKIDDNVTIGYDYVIVSWKSSANRPNNPASTFAVEYQPEGLAGTDEWIRAAIDNENNAANISGLTYGDTYLIRVVALDREMSNDGSVPSDPVKVTVGMQPAVPITQSASSSSWYIVLICLLAVLLLLILIIVLFRYNRGGRYPVQEKEKLHGANGGHLDEEDRFCEYVRGEDPVKKKSQGSLESSSPSEEEDGSDSLGVYEDADPTKFNDEGSFIDQSGYRKTIDGHVNAPTRIV